LESENNEPEGFAVDEEFMSELEDRLENSLAHMSFCSIHKATEGVVIEGYYEGDVRIWIFQSYIKAEDDITVIDRDMFRSAINNDDVEDATVAFGTSAETLEEDVSGWFFEHIESAKARKIRKEMG
jgi:hypothetical protein